MYTGVGVKGAIEQRFRVDQQPHVENVTLSRFQVQMQAFEDLQLQRPVSVPPVMSLGSELYMQLNASRVPEGAALFVDACDAVSAEDAGAKRAVIAGGCAADAGTAFISPRDRSTVAFRLQAFRFSRAPDHHILLRCNVRVCSTADLSPNCSRDCNRVQHPEIERPARRSPAERSRRSVGRRVRKSSDPIAWDIDMHMQLPDYAIRFQNARIQPFRIVALSVFIGIILLATLLGIFWEINSFKLKPKQ